MRAKTILFLGLTPPPTKTTHIHCPIIKIVARDPNTSEITRCFQQLNLYTHLIFTSKSSVTTFLCFLSFFKKSPTIFSDTHILALGSKTAEQLQKAGIKVTVTAKEETAEGIIDELRKISLDKAHLFWPHSSLSRPLIRNFLQENLIPFTECILYDTHPQKPDPMPDLNVIDEIVFTSPSCINAFLLYFGQIPQDKILTAIGPVTQAHLSNQLASLN